MADIKIGGNFPLHRLTWQTGTLSGVKQEQPAGDTITTTGGALFARPANSLARGRKKRRNARQLSRIKFASIGPQVHYNCLNQGMVSAMSMAVTQSIEPLDYPAAHSMDTDWFGIDGDGNVAVFSTGENGILPEIAATDTGTPDIIDLLMQEGRVKCDLGDVLARKPNITMENLEQIANILKKGDLGKPDWQSKNSKGTITSTSYSVKAPDTNNDGAELAVWVQKDELTKKLSCELWDCLLVCADSAPVIPPDEQRRGEPRQLLCTSKVDFVLLNIPGISFENLRQLFLDRVVSRGWTHPKIDLRRFGFFEYDIDNLWDDRYLPEVHQPVIPITIDQLPLRVQEQIASASFPDISFARKDEIWPRRYYRCRTWTGEL